jgi:diacylglycerol kinase (ATP)
VLQTNERIKKMKRIAIIYNPNAGTFKRNKLNEIVKRLEQNNKVSLFETLRIGHATEIANREQNNFDVVVAAGGDGTIHEVINGIGSKTHLGIIPLGTANILAIEAGIDKDVASICNRIEHGQVRKAYVPRVNEKKFILMVGIGYDGDVVHHMQSGLKKIFGKLLFIYLGILGLIKLKKYKIEVQTEKGNYQGNWVLVTKAKHYAGKYSITKDTDIFNPQIICYVFQNITRLGFLSCLFSILFKGEIGNQNHVIQLEAKEISITSDQSVNVQCDGEKFGPLPLSIQNKLDSISLII